MTYGPVFLYPVIVRLGVHDLEFTWLWNSLGEGELSTLEGLVIFGSIHVLLTLWEPLSVFVTEEGDVLVGNDDFKI